MERMQLVIATGLLVVLAGCVPVYPDVRPPKAEPEPAPELGRQFDPQATGTIRGQVRWTSERPKVEPVTGAVPDGPGRYRFARFPAPYAPSISQEFALAGAVLMLNDVDRSQSKPWNHPPVRVRHQEAQLRWATEAGGVPTIGILRQGAELAISTEDSIPHNLRARGAAFFAHPLPIGATPSVRRLDQVGRVELSSGMGYFWIAADLYVMDHPYICVTDDQGRFELDQVPSGDYQLRLRLPNWQVVRQERDPETGLIFRQYYAEPFEKIVPVQVRPQATVELRLTLP